MFSDTEIRQLHLGIPSVRRNWLGLLDSAGLTCDQEPDYALGLYDACDRLVGCAALCGNIIKGVAIDEQARGTAAANKLITGVRDEGIRRGHDNLFIFTKPEYAATFGSLAFHQIASGPGVVLLESGRRALSSYCAYLSSLPRGKRNGVIVMNANPLTRGHLYVIEHAAAMVDALTIIPLAENEHNSFSYAERRGALLEATACMPNVTVAEGSPYCISASTFPSYFIKSVNERTDAHIGLDLNLFVNHIAPALGATVRFVGTEPTDRLTARYNELMAETLPAHGIEVKQVERLAGNDGIPFSASRVRGEMADGALGKALSVAADASMPLLLGHAAADALRAELALTPKPGLVDRENNGAHKDMDFALMSRSIDAIQPYFVRMARAAAGDALPCAGVLQPIGIKAEKAMFEATHGVNTHRGAIFSMGLMVSAAAWLLSGGKELSARSLCETVGAIARSFAAPERTHGSLVAAEYGIPTAVDMACSGYAPLFGNWLGEHDLHRRLLLIISQLEDSNLYYRGGREGVAFAREKVSAALASSLDNALLRKLDAEFTARNLSPGGAADMLALSVFIDKLLN